MKKEIPLGLTYPTTLKTQSTTSYIKTSFWSPYEKLNTNFTNSINNITKWNTHGTNQQQQHIQFNNNLI